MSAHRLLNDLANTRLTASGKMLYMEEDDVHLISWGEGVPTTLDAKYYFRTDPTAGSHIYYNNGSTWVALS